MGTRKNNRKAYLLDSNGNLDPNAVRSYKYMLAHPSYFSENLIFILAVTAVVLLISSGILFFFGVETLMGIGLFLVACWIIVRV